MNTTITLADGYNGHCVECDAEPIKIDDDIFTLRVTGTHMVRVCTREEWRKARERQTTRLDADTLRALEYAVVEWTCDGCFRVLRYDGIATAIANGIKRDRVSVTGADWVLCGECQDRADASEDDAADIYLNTESAALAREVNP